MKINEDPNNISQNIILFLANYLAQTETFRALSSLYTRYSTQSAGFKMSPNMDKINKMSNTVFHISYIWHTLILMCFRF